MSLFFCLWFWRSVSLPLMGEVATAAGGGLREQNEAPRAKQLVVLGTARGLRWILRSKRQRERKKVVFTESHIIYCDFFAAL